MLEKCYICTVLLLMRTKTISVGSLTRCPGHIQYIKLLVVMGGLYLSHNFYNITETALFLCIRAENYTVTFIYLRQHRHYTVSCKKWTKRRHFQRHKNTLHWGCNNEVQTFINFPHQMKLNCCKSTPRYYFSNSFSHMCIDVPHVLQKGLFCVPFSVFPAVAET